MFGLCECYGGKPLRETKVKQVGRAHALHHRPRSSFNESCEQEHNPNDPKGGELWVTKGEAGGNSGGGLKAS